MITGTTRLICSLGDPVSHSLSPLIHNEGFKLLNLDYVFLCFNTKITQVEETLSSLKRLNARGFSCTMPVKRRISELVDELSPAAELMSAVNAAVIEDGKIYGHNTDGIGYVTALKEAGYDFKNKKITLLGSGGVATAMAVQTALDGASEISIFNRLGESFDRCQIFAKKLKQNTSCRVNTYNLNDADCLKSEIAESYILANGTSVGMWPNENDSPISDRSVFHKDLIVTDAIYNPRDTKLLKEAHACDCATLGGLSMLLYQGAAAFKLWTGDELPVDAVKDIISR